MNNLLRRSQLFIKRNSATILTGAATVGVVATGVMAVKATPKALLLLEEAKREKGEELSKFEVVKTAAPAYIPTLLVGGSTIACILGANILNKRTQASLMSAFALVDNSYKEYRGKMLELYGKEAHENVQMELAKDKYEEVKEEMSHSKELQTFYDSFSGRFFESTIEKVQNAEYFINRDLCLRDWATVNEFYAYLEIDEIEGGDELGWSAGMNFDYYWTSWIDFGHQKMPLADDMECTVITMFCEPCLGWEDYS